MRRVQPVQDFPARGKGIQCSNLVGPHEAAIALNVSCKNRLSTPRERPSIDGDVTSAGGI
jgi:hypothetical protein